MAITFKVAHAPREIDDALWLRHQVYVIEEGRFGALPDRRMVDRFDVIPKVAYVLAYDNHEPVASLRLNCDMGLGLPCELYFDFRPFIPRAHQEDAGEPPVVVSAGMLVVQRFWRRRQDILPSLYRVATGVFFTWKATHIVATVGQATASIYFRAGFRAVAEARWSKEVGDHIIPIMANAEDCFRWAFRSQLGPDQPVWHERRRTDWDFQQQAS